MNILVCGDRNWKDRNLIKGSLEIYNIFNPVIIHGDCKGADKLAGAVASELGFSVKSYPADWSQGRKAGPIRNSQMLEENDIDIVLAFHDHLDQSKGTADMVRKAKKKGIIVVEYNHKDYV